MDSELLTNVKREETANKDGIPFTDADMVDKEVCDANVPSRFNIYRWAKEHPKRTISMGIARMEKIFDEADEIIFGFSAGKDSTATANQHYCGCVSR